MRSICNLLAHTEGHCNVDPAYQSAALPQLTLRSLATPKPPFLEPSASCLPVFPLLKRPLSTTFRLTNLLFLQSETPMCSLEEPSPTPTEESAAASVSQTEPQCVLGHSILSICTVVQAVSSFSQNL